MSLSAEIEKIKFAFLWKFKLDIPFLKVYKILYFALSFVLKSKCQVQVSLAPFLKNQK